MFDRFLPSRKMAWLAAYPGTVPLPPKPRVGRGARPTKLRRKPGNESMSVKGQGSRVKGMLIQFLKQHVPLPQEKP